MNRVPTSIPGFDELVDGGFLDNDVILLTGGPGAGKSTFGTQFLYDGIIKHGEAGVYVTMQETPARIMRNMWGHNWDLERLVKEDKLRLISADPMAFSKYMTKSSSSEADITAATLEELLKYILKNVQEIRAKRLFIDPITSLKISSSHIYYRHSILELIKNIENFDCTTLMTIETDPTSRDFNVEEYLAEGVIHMHILRKNGKKMRALEVFKMRGTKHDESLHPYAITEEGIVIYKSESLNGNEVKRR